jgi:hypothetical protein
MGSHVSDPTKPALTRREFATGALLTGAAATLSVVSPTPAATLAAVSPTPAPAIPPQSATPPAPSEASQAESAQRLQTILALYGSRFSEDQKADLKKICNSTQSSLDRLRAYPTGNADDPALYLKPLWEREKKPASVPATEKHPTPAPAKP